jgi:predicted alpha/beta-fold hydrolase
LFEAGFSVFRLNFRDHGETQALNEGLFHSCRIDEVARAATRVREQFPTRHFAIVGQSLGGNFALRIAARASREGLEIGRVLAVCPVLRPHSTMLALDRGWWLYRRYFLARWRRSLLAKAEVFPHLYQFGDLRRFDTLTATTEFFVENYTEFESLDRYLEGYAIVGDALSVLDAPCRILVAADDPIIPVADLALLARPSALEITTLRRGGHCGFVDRLNGPSWIDRMRKRSAMDDIGPTSKTVMPLALRLSAAKAQIRVFSSMLNMIPSCTRVPLVHELVRSMTTGRGCLDGSLHHTLFGPRWSRCVTCAGQ